MPRALHDDVVINEFAASAPGCYFRQRTPQRDGEFFITCLERAIAQVMHKFCGFLLIRTAIINNVIRNLILFPPC
jgi:hypothetical protein